MNLALYLIVAGVVLLVGVYLLLRQRQRASHLPRNSLAVPVNLATTSDAILLASGHGRVVYANTHARQWFRVDGGEPNLEVMAEAVRPPDAFRDLFAAEGRASFQVGLRRVEAASYLLPGQGERHMVVVMRDMASARGEYGPDTVQALVVLGEIGRVVSTHTPLPDMLEAVLGHIRQAVAYDAGEVALWEGEAGALRPLAQAGDASFLRALDNVGGVYQENGGYGGWLATYRQPLLIEDADDRRSEAPPPVIATVPFRSYIGVPLLVDGTFIGALHLVGGRPGAFDYEDLALLEAVASQVATAVDKARLLQEKEARASELAGVQAIAQTAVSAADRRQLFALLTEHIARAMAVEVCGILLYDPGHERLVAEAPFYGLPDAVVNTYRIKLSPETVARRVWLRDEGWYSNWLREEALIEEIGLLDLLDVAGLRSLALVPMVLGNRRIGMVQVSNRRDGRGFGPEDLHPLRIFAAQAAIVVHSAQLMEQEGHHRQEFQGLQQIARRVGQAGDFSDFYGEASEQVAGLLGVEMCGLLLYDAAQEVLVGQAPFFGVDDALLEYAQIPVPAGSAMARQWQEAEFWLCNDLSQDPLASQAGLDPLVSWVGMRQVLLAPLVVAGRHVGAVLASNRRDGLGLTEDDARLFCIYAAQMALVLDHARLQGEVEARLRELAVIRRVAEIARQQAPLEAVVQDMLAAAAAFFNSEIALVDFLDTGSGELRLDPAYVYGATLAKPLVADAYRPGFEHSVAISGRPFLSNALAEDRRVLAAYRPAIQELGLRRVIMAPLRVGGASAGELIVANRRDGDYSERDLEVLGAIAGQLSAAIERARLSEATDKNLRARVAELDALGRVSNELSVTVELDRITAVIRQEALRVTGAAGCTSLILAPEEEWSGVEQPEVLQRHGAERLISGTAPIEQQAMQGGEPVVVTDYGEHALQPAPAEAVSALAVPIVYEERAVGVIHLYDTKAGAFGERAEAFLSALAFKAATAYANSARFREQISRNLLLSKRVEQLNQIFELGQVLRTESNLEDILEAVAHAVQMSVGFSVVLISLYDEQEQGFRRVAQAGIPLAQFEEIRQVVVPLSRVGPLLRDDFRISHSYFLPAERAAEWRAPDALSDEYVHYHKEYATKWETDAWQPDDALVLPLRDSRGQWLGLMSVDAPVDGRRPSRTTVETLEIFAHQAAISVENFRLIEAIQREAETARRERDVLQHLYLVSSEIQQAEDIPTRLQVVAGGIRDVGWRRVHITMRDARLDPTALFYVGYSDEEADILQQNLTPGEVWRRRLADPAFHELRVGSAYYLRYDAPWVVQHLRGGVPPGEDERVPPGAWHPDDQLFLPIYGAENRLIGLIGMEDPADGKVPTAEALRPIALFASQAASAIELTRLYQESSRAAEQESLVNEVMQAVTSALDTPRIVQAVADGLQRLMPFTSMQVALYDPDGEQFRTLEAHFVSVTEVKVLPGEPLASGDTALGEAFREGRGRILHEEDEATYADVAAWRQRQERTTMLVPMQVGGNVVGVLHLGSELSHAFGFDEENMAMVQRLANLAAVAIQNAYLYEQTAERERFSAALVRLNAELNATLDLSTTLESICQVSLDILGVDGAYIWQVDNGDLVGIAGVGPGRDAFLGMRIPRDDERVLAVRAFNTLQPLYINDVAGQRDVRVVLSEYVAASGIMSVPLLREGRALGVLSLVETEAARPFTPVLVERASIFATQASIALENARLYQETRDLQRFLGAIVESIQQGIVVLDREGRVTTFNAYMRQQYGWEDNALGQALFAYRPAYEPTLAQALEGVLATGRPHVRFNAAGQAPDGASIVQNFYLYPLHEGQEVTGVVLLVEDVTEQALLEANLAERASQLAALTEVSSRLTATLEPDEVITLVLDQLGQVLPYDGVTLWLREGDVLRIVSARGYEGSAEELVGLEVSIEDSALFRDMATRREVLNVPDVGRDPRFPGGGERPTRNWLGAPLISKDTIIGLLALDKVEPGYYRQNHEQLALAFANQAAVALENARLFAETRDRTTTLAQQTERLALLNRVSTMLAQSLDVENILEIALQESARALGGTSGRAVTFDLSQQVGTVVVEYPRGDAPPTEVIPLSDNPAVDYVRRTLQPLVVDEARDEPLLAPLRPDLLARGVTSLVLVPLSVGGQVIGMLMLEGVGEARHFAAEQVELAQTIASQAAIAVQNANLFEQSVVRTRELETLFDASQATALTLDLDEVIRSVAQQMLYALDADGCAVMLWDEVEQNLVVHIDLNREGDAARADPPGTVYPLAEYPARLQALEDRALVIVGQGEEDADPREQAELAERGGTARMLVPLVVREQAIGLIKVELHRAFRAFGLSEQRIARTLAGQAAIAIENARLNSETAAQIQEAFIINDLSRAVSAAVDMDELLPIVRAQIPSLTRAEWLYLALYDAQSDTLRFPVAVHQGRDVPMPERSLGNDEFSWILRFKRPLLLVGGELMDVRRNLNIETTLPAIRSFLGVPLSVGDEAVGVLAVGDEHNPRAFGLNDQRILSTVAGQLAVTVQNARLFEELRRFNQELEQRVRERTEELRAERDRLNTLYNITAELSATLDMDRVLERALTLLLSAVGADQGVIMLIDHQQDRLYTRAELGQNLAGPAPEGGLRVNEGLAGWVIQHRQSVVIDDVQQDPRWLQAAPQDAIPRATLAVLLETSDEVQGVLLLFSARAGAFDQNHLRVVVAAANQLATSINNAELYRYIREQAERLGEMVHEQQIEASKSNAILEGVADGVMVADEAGQIILFNSAAERILGIDRRQLLGRPISSLSGLYGGGGRRWMETIQQWMAEPARIHSGDYLAETLDTGEKVISVALSPVHMADQFLGTVSVLRDITHEVEVDRMKTEFISNVSHELRTPMTSIKGYADLLVLGAAGEVSERQREFLLTIKNNADRLGHLVNDLLDISRIDSGRANLKWLPVQVEQVVHAALANLSQRIESQGRSLTVLEELPDDLPGTYADPAKLTQIITNLVDNAYQYTPDGGKITVAARLEGDSFLITVADTGVGIPRRLHDRVFDRFFRNDEQPLVMETAGTGLGLAIVKELVEMHGGRIWFESEEGQGTTFFVMLPWREQPPAGAEAEEA